MRKKVHRMFYDVMSHQNAAVICFLCLLVLVISAFQFGEVWVDWSRGTYASVFNQYDDNILGKSFQSKLCQHVPIDVVYTWVNGSDPRRAEELRDVLSRLNEALATGGDASNDEDDYRCTFTDCVPSTYLVLSPALPKDFNSEELAASWAPASDAIAFKTASVRSANSTLVRFDGVRARDRAFAAGRRFSFWGVKYYVCQGFWTSDVNVPFTEASSNVVLLTKTSKESLRHGNLTMKLVPPDLRSEVVNVFPNHAEKVAVITFASVRAAEDFLQREPIVAGSVALKGFLLLRNSPLLDSLADAGPQRFRDNDELRYSLRSVETHAPWVRKVFLVTAGQIPHWLNLDNPRITVVTHEEIFPNKSHLPSFSSPAIESHLHRIPGLSDKFLYLNDDVLFGKEVWPEDFYSDIRGQKVYLSWDVQLCDPGCPEAWIHDGACDLACNISVCQFDGGDCDVNDGTLPNGVSPSLVDHDWNGWGDDVDGPYCAHLCSNAWLADKYCDQSCNKPECGYDAGDCGEARLRNLPVLQPSDARPDSLNEMSLRLTQPAFVFNFTAVFPGAVVTNGVHSSNPGLRTVALLLKHRCVVVVAYKDAKNLSFVDLSLSGRRRRQDLTLDFRIHLEPAYSALSVEKDAAADYVWDWNPGNATEDFLEIRQENSVEVPNWGRIGRMDIVQPLDPEVDPEAFATLMKTLKDIHKQGLDAELTRDGVVKLRARAMRDFVSPFFAETGRLPGKFVISRNNTEVKAERVVELFGFDAEVVRFSTRKLKDAFGDSIRRVNNLFNIGYGFEPRRVAAHTPHLIDKHVMMDLQEKFKREFEATSSYQVRTGVDMQYAFSYYYFLMSERKDFVAAEVFDEFDTDGSGTWSDREIRTLLTRIVELPLTFEVLTGFEQDLRSCANSLPKEFSSGISTPAFERYVDSDLPVISKKLVLACEVVLAKLKAKFGSRKHYKFEVATGKFHHFTMLVSNVTTALSELDDIRRDPRKFLCLNDDLDEASPDSDTVAALRADFFESLLPVRSSFELPENYRNRFLRVEELDEWRLWRRHVRLVTYFCFFALVVFTVASFFHLQVNRIWRRFRTSRGLPHQTV